MSSIEVQIEGDKHGRCAGVVYLRNKTNGAKVFQNNIFINTVLI